jgi:general secretion pathway protein A
VEPELPVVTTSEEEPVEAVVAEEVEELVGNRGIASLQVAEETPLATPEPAEEPSPVLTPPAPLTLYQRLFALWGHEVEAGAADHPCALANSHGLRCLQGRADIEELKKINRPALLYLQGETGREMVLLKKIENGHFQLVDQGGQELALMGLANLWRGSYFLLWRPLGGVALLGTGSSGPEVTLFRQMFSKVDGEPAEVPRGLDRFDESLRLRLQRFQQSQGLEPDGVVGPQTMIALNNQLHHPGTPTLLGED